MNSTFESTNIDEVKKSLEHLNRFHDDHVAEIEIKFEKYKRLNDDGDSTAIKKADKTIILTVNAYPYGQEHKQFIKVEFKDVKLFEIFSSLEDSRPKAGPTWGIVNTLLLPDGIDIRWQFEFICGDSKFLVICSRIIFHKQNV